MSEYRQNVVTREWVIIAPERRGRPHEVSFTFTLPELKEYDPNCPFCPGGVSEHEHTIYELKEAGEWVLRVVPNKYAPCSEAGTPHRRIDGNFVSISGYGIAEVVIESRKHNKTLATYSLHEIENILTAYLVRYRELTKLHPKIDLVTIFRNYGPLAGTSLLHPHSQIIATPIVPAGLRNSFYEARRYCDAFGTCVVCDYIKRELDLGTRIILCNEHFVVLEPFAARMPFETWIVPLRHHAGFDLRDDELPALATAISTTFRKLHKLMHQPSYNLIIKTAPVGQENVEHLHWYIEILVRTAGPAGFELGSGIYINPIPPEEAASLLRDIVT